MKTDDTIPANEALARLCNAECMLQVALGYLDEHLTSNEEWRVSESLRGILRLLDGVYVALGTEIDKRASGDIRTIARAFVVNLERDLGRPLTQADADEIMTIVREVDAETGGAQP